MIQIIYAVLWIDRHVDETVHLFTNMQVAIAWAKKQADDNNLHGYEPDADDLPELNDTDFIAYFPYNGEGDSLRVMALELDGDAKTNAKGE